MQIIYGPHAAAAAACRAESDACAAAFYIYSYITDACRCGLSYAQLYMQLYTVIYHTRAAAAFGRDLCVIAPVCAAAAFGCDLCVIAGPALFPPIYSDKTWNPKQ